MDCLDFIPECCCPHYDGESDRRPSVHSMIESGKISSCLAVEDGAAIHYKDNKLLTSVSFYKNKKSYIVKKTESGIIEEEIGAIQL
jgi:dipeptidase E